MADSDPSAVQGKKPWALTLFGLLAAGGLTAMPFLAGPPGSGEMPGMVRFIGHFHPVLLHLPIGVFVLILFQELVAICGRRGDGQKSTSVFPLLFGTVSAIVSVIAGFMLYHGHGDEYGGNPLAERHLWGGILFAVAAVVTFLFKMWTEALSTSPAFYRMLLFVSMGAMVYASHDGASMTHGSDYLTVFAPEPIRTFIGPGPKDPKATATATTAGQFVYADIVAPILERRCVQCHKEGKAKGKFRMDQYELLVKGGKEGSGIEPGKSAESNILIRMALPKDDEEHMPPEGKSEIEDSEIAIIKWWIDNGADPQKKISEFEVPEPIRQAIAKLAPVAVGPDDALKSAVARISKEFPGTLGFESQSSALLAFTAVPLRGNLDDAGFKKFEAVTTQLVSVDLSATKITDKAVAQLVSAKKLRLIRLAETAVTDVAIDTLAKLPILESVNLYGTKITDAGVVKLAALAHLKRLYLWQTAVTPAAIKALKEKLPACEIITSIDS